MDLTSETPPITSIHPPRPRRAPVNRWVLSITIIGILVVGVLFSLIYFTTAQVSTKNFSYNSPPDSGGTYKSLSVSDVDGLVTIQQWPQHAILINGTITARGLGSSPSIVNINNSTNNGDVLFRASFPVSGGFFFSQSYSVSVNVFLPSTIRLASVQVSNVNGGVRIQNLNATDVRVTSVNGALSIGCLYCQNLTAVSTGGNISGSFSTLVTLGSYNLTTTNANISFSAPNSSSFKLTASGAVSCLFPGCTASGQGVLAQTFGGGSASVRLTSAYGQITISAT